MVWDMVVGVEEDEDTVEIVETSDLDRVRAFLLEGMIGLKVVLLEVTGREERFTNLEEEEDEEEELLLFRILEPDLRVKTGGWVRLEFEEGGGGSPILILL